MSESTKQNVLRADPPTRERRNPVSRHRLPVVDDQRGIGVNKASKEAIATAVRASLEVPCPLLMRIDSHFSVESATDARQMRDASREWAMTTYSRSNPSTARRSRKIPPTFEQPTNSDHLDEDTCFLGDSWTDDINAKVESISARSRRAVWQRLSMGWRDHAESRVVFPSRVG